MPRAATRMSIRIAALLGAALLTGATPVSAAPSDGIVARIPLGDPVPDPILDGTFGLGALWVSVGGDEIARIDPTTNTIAERITVGAGFRHEIATGAGMVWVTNPDEDTVSRIDPATNTVTGTFSSGGSLPIGIASTPGAVWVSNHHADDSGRGSVVRLDPSSGAVVATITLGAETFAGGPGGMTVAAGSVWVSVPNLGAVARIDPASNEVSSLIPMDGPCGIPASVGAYVVVPSFGCGRTSLARIDASSNTLGKLNPGGISRFAAGASGSMWVTVTSASCPPKCPPSTTALSRVDPLTGVVISRLPLEGFGFVAAGADSIWVGVGATGEVLRSPP